MLLFAIYAATAAPSLSWRNGGDDGGDLAVAATLLTVAHPSGYPLYVLLGHVWQAAVAAGDAAHRLNLLSAAAGAAAAALTVWAGTELALGIRQETSQRHVVVGAVLGGLLFGLGPQVWGQAVVVSVYTLNAAFAAALLGLIMRAQRLGASVRGAVVFGLLLGLGSGNHLTLGFAGVEAALTALIERWPLKVWAVALVAVAVGACAVYAYLLAGAVEARDPIAAWGDPSTPAGLFGLVSARSYQGLVGSVPAPQVAERLVRAAALLTAALTPVGLLAAVGGGAGALAGTHRPRFLVGPLTLVIAALLFALTYGGARGEHHLILVYVAG
ncbi:MAG: DUF2723 domain-containing protein, partial [Chloroflexi bacterium]|nr:DUF2723 domain-containing protein [Chloroflexota bacterium]